MSKSTRDKFIRGMASVIAFSPQVRRFYYQPLRKGSIRRAWESVGRAWSSALNETDKNYGLVVVDEKLSGSAPTECNMVTKIKYFIVPATSDVFLKADDLIEWVDSVLVKYPELGKLGKEFEGMVSNLKNSARKTHEASPRQTSGTIDCGADFD